MAEAESAGERGEPAVGHLLLHQPSGEGTRVDEAVGQARPSRPGQLGVEESEVVAHVVADDDGLARELEEARQHLRHGRGGDDHGLGDAGEHGDGGRDRRARVHECLEGAEALASAHLDRSDLGDRAHLRRGAGGLEVEDAEGDLGERGAEVVERPLHGPRG